MRALVVALTVLTAAFAAHGDVRLMQPVDGARLDGGSVVTLQWSGERPAHAEEWEAFLSVDGGRYYATRLTPHLDIALRQFDVRLPNVSADDVRILLRFGDERREVEVDSPARFTLRFDPSAPPSHAVMTRGEGESARSGEPAVAMWVSGERSGTSLLLHVHRAASCGEGTIRPGRLAAGEEGESTGSDSLTPPSSSAGAEVPRHAGAPAPSVALSRDVLLLVRRLNI